MSWLVDNHNIMHKYTAEILTGASIATGTTMTFMTEVNSFLRALAFIVSIIAAGLAIYKQVKDLKGKKNESNKTG